jgi:hypothetical protein
MPLPFPAVSSDFTRVLEQQEVQFRRRGVYGPAVGPDTDDGAERRRGDAEANDLFRLDRRSVWAR